jgi:sulfur carrier protein
MVIINGEEKNVQGISIADYLEQEGHNTGRVVVERNLTIVPREKWGETVIEDGDSIEVLQFVGGG